MVPVAVGVKVLVTVELGVAVLVTMFVGVGVSVGGIRRGVARCDGIGRRIGWGGRKC